MRLTRLGAFFSSALLRGSAVVASARVATMAFGLAVNMLLARILPLDQLGAYFLLASLAQVGALVSMGGATQSAIPIISGAQDGHERRALRGLLLYSGAITLVCALMVYALFEPIATRIGLSQTGNTMAALTALWLVGRAVSQLFAHALRAFGKMALFGLLETLVFNAAFCAVVLWYFLTDIQVGLERVVVASAVVAGIGVVAGAVPLWRMVRTLQDQPGVDLKRTLTLSAPLWVMVVANAGLADAHLWVASAFGGEESAALFGVALRVTRLLGLPLLAVNMAIGPRAALLWREGKRDELEQLLRNAATAVSLLSIAVCATIYLFGPSTLEVLFGAAFVAAWPAIVVMLAGGVINACTGSPVLLMAVSSAQRMVMAFSLASGAIGIGMSILLGRNDPVLGVAIGSATTVVLLNLLAVFYCRRYLGIRTLPMLTRPRRADTE